MTVIELEYPEGGRFWTRPLPATEAIALAYDMIAKQELYWSDIDCSGDCWCVSHPSGKVNL
jgi:hypothetical protein